MLTKTASRVGSRYDVWKLGRGFKICCGNSFACEELFKPRLILLAIERFDADPFSLELSDNRELFTESLSSEGISHFGIFSCLKFLLVYLTSASIFNLVVQKNLKVKSKQDNILRIISTVLLLVKVVIRC